MNRVSCVGCLDSPAVLTHYYNSDITITEAPRLLLHRNLSKFFNAILESVQSSGGKKRIPRQIAFQNLRALCHYCPNWLWQWDSPQSLSVRTPYFCLKRISPNQQVLMKGRLIKWAKSPWTEFQQYIGIDNISESTAERAIFRHGSLSISIHLMPTSRATQQHSSI